MGLCKCRKVTPLYCFVHKKHVCGGCIVNEHKTCQVRSYLQWLQDSDCDAIPTCRLCSNELDDDTALRLTCLDVFHARCLDAHCASLPSHTAPAGYQCPTCSKGIVPAPEDAGEIASVLREHLQNASWAGHLGLGGGGGAHGGSEAATAAAAAGVDQDAQVPRLLSNGTPSPASSASSPQAVRMQPGNHDAATAQPTYGTPLSPSLASPDHDLDASAGRVFGDGPRQQHHAAGVVLMRQHSGDGSGGGGGDGGGGGRVGMTSRAQRKAHMRQHVYDDAVDVEDGSGRHAHRHYDSDDDKYKDKIAARGGGSVMGDVARVASPAAVARQIRRNPALCAILVMMLIMMAGVMYVAQTMPPDQTGANEPVTPTGPRR